MNAVHWDITVPVDASESSRRGVDFALDLGNQGATLHFCSVVDATSAYLGGATGAPIDPAPILAAMQVDAQRTCDRAVAAAQERGVTADGKVIFGAVVPAIERYAGQVHSNALVIGTHARTGAVRAVLGSVAESLMQSSSVPLVITHVDDVAGDGPVTVAIEAMPADRSAVLMAIDLARSRERSLSILTVSPGGRRRWAAAAVVLSDAADLARAAGIEFDLVTLTGHVADTIVASAQRRRSPMIVVGTSGRSDLARFVFGSVAAGVVERARMPVVVVRP
jgi:nucleotide-binding universal stress UspA family protein